MSSKIKSGSRRHSWILLLSSLMVVALGPAQTAVVSAFQSTRSTLEEKSSSETLRKKLTIASMQHETILLLIDSKTVDRVESEWKTVLDLQLGAKYEAAIADSLLTIGYKLLEAKQLPLAQKLLDESLAAVPFSNKSKTNVLKFKAYLFKEAGDYDNAIKTVKLANELADK